MQFGVIFVSHLGRPRPGIWESSLSLSTLCDPLESLLGKSVTFLSDGQGRRPIWLQEVLHWLRILGFLLVRPITTCV